MNNRNIPKVLEEVSSLSTMSLDTAMSCFYVNFSEGKPFVGITVRFAEIIASSWGNLNTSTSIVKNDGKYLYIKGAVEDVEKNSKVEIEILKRVVDRFGNQLSSEELTKVSSAASSIAFRNAIFKAIPAAYLEGVIKGIKSFISESLTDEVLNEYISFFENKGVSKEELYDKATFSNAKESECKLHIIGMKNAIEGGDASIEDLFGKKSPRKSKFSFDEVEESTSGIKTDTSFIKDIKIPELSSKDDKSKSDKTNPFEHLNKGETRVIEKEIPLVKGEIAQGKRGKGRPRKQQKK